MNIIETICLVISFKRQIISTPQFTNSPLCISQFILLGYDVAKADCSCLLMTDHPLRQTRIEETTTGCKTMIVIKPTNHPWQHRLMFHREAIRSALQASVRSTNRKSIPGAVRDSTAAASAVMWRGELSLPPPATACHLIAKCADHGSTCSSGRTACGHSEGHGVHRSKIIGGRRGADSPRRSTGRRNHPN